MLPPVTEQLINVVMSSRRTPEKGIGEARLLRGGIDSEGCFGNHWWRKRQFRSLRVPCPSELGRELEEAGRHCKLDSILN